MYGFEHNDIDPQDVIPIRTLKVSLRTKLPYLEPKILQRIEEAFAEQMKNSESINGLFLILRFFVRV